MSKKILFEETLKLDGQYSLDIEILINQDDIDAEQFNLMDDILFQYIQINNFKVEHFLTGKKILKVLKDIVEQKFNIKVLKITCVDTISKKINILK